MQESISSKHERKKRRKYITMYNTHKKECNTPFLIFRKYCNVIQYSLRMNGLKKKLCVREREIIFNWPVGKIAAVSIDCCISYFIRKVVFITHLKEMRPRHNIGANSQNNVQCRICLVAIYAINLQHPQRMRV